MKNLLKHKISKNFRSKVSHQPVKSRRLRLESLELRDVPATITYSATELTVTGTSGDDRLQLVETPTASISIYDNNVFRGTYDTQGRTISVLGSGGNDEILIDVLKNIVVDGGSGEDTIRDSYNVATINGGDDNDTIAGGLTVNGGAGNDTFLGSVTAYGDEGDDEIFGSGIAYGGVGNDTISGG